MKDYSSLLPWLPAPPPNFRDMVRSLATSEPLDGKQLRRLAATDMNLTQLSRLAQTVVEKCDEITSEGSYLPLRLGLVGSHTLDFIDEGLVATGLRHGLLLTITRAPYGQVEQTILDPSSGMKNGQVDVVLLALDTRSLGLHQPHFSVDEAEAAVDAAIFRLATLRDGIRDRLGAVAAFQTLPLPADPLFGAFDSRMKGSPRFMADAFNQRLSGILLSGDIIVDVAFAAASVGLVRWHDARAWHSAKLPFAPDITPFYADHICRVLAAFRGKSRKCLVLDLDNTLWGGVIGDDGLDGIVFGNGSGAGEAFVAVQSMALDLRKRGIILAVCSKNDIENASLPFREHREMILREQHFACFVANWADKAANLRDIARTLNIGADSLVFLDDNPAERAIVRQELPEVAVPEVGDDPSEYPAMISRAGYFEALSFSDEDRQRADIYRANAERLQLQGSITNLADYLTSLQMKMYAKPFEAANRSRIAQLINKSNQFNLTSRRYSEAQVQALEEDPGRFTLQVGLTDRFGDNGIISVIIFDKGLHEWSCDTWLMSCRVLGRRVEEAVLTVVAEAAKAEGAKSLIGRFLPTKKNSLVADHFAKLNFALRTKNDDASTEWHLDLSQFQAPSLPIEVTTRNYKEDADRGIGSA